MGPYLMLALFPDVTYFLLTMGPDLTILYYNNNNNNNNFI